MVRQPANDESWAPRGTPTIVASDIAPQILWARRWHALDPVKAGTAPSTRDALAMLVTEMKARQVPDAVSGIVARFVARACPTGR